MLDATGRLVDIEYEIELRSDPLPRDSVKAWSRAAEDPPLPNGESS